jgi:hypothetical protein
VRETIRVENPRIGWIKPDTSVGSLRRSPPVSDEASGQEERSGRSVGTVADSQLQRCWRKEKRIARIDSELRRGYKLKRGRELRRQRDELEEYRRRFCR